jgi:hypothetical protein
MVQAPIDVERKKLAQGFLNSRSVRSEFGI